MLSPVVLLISILALAICNELDVQASERGFAAGFLEGNGIVVALFGQKPAAWKLRLYGLVTQGLLPCLGALFLDAQYADFAASGVMVAAAGKHLMAVRKWSLTMDGKYVAPSSALMKFLGFIPHPGLRLCNLVQPKMRVGDTGSTVRNGRKWFDQAQIGDNLVLCACSNPQSHAGENVYGMGKVTDVRLKPFIQLASDEIETNHANGVATKYEELLLAMQRAYPGFTADSEVTVLFYRRTV
jgi:hypothetical protein